MKILITGGAGFLGSHLAEAFLERGDEVFVLDTGPEDKVRHLLAHPRFHLHRESILDADALGALVARVDLVYHLAAVVGVEHYVEDPYKVLNINVNGTQLVLRLAHEHGKKVVFSSTSEVYGKSTRVPFREDSDRLMGPTTIDRWCYANSKAIGEHFCHAYRRMGLKVVIVRYFNVYGPRLDGLDRGRVMTIFLGQILRGEPISVIGDGSQTRSFTYVTDAVRATVAAGLVEAAEGGTFNIGSAVETSVLELAEAMRRLTRADSPIRFVHQELIYGKSYEDIPRRVPDTTRMQEILGVECLIDLEEGLGRTLRWFQDETVVTPPPAAGRELRSLPRGSRADTTTPCA